MAESLRVGPVSEGNPKEGPWQGQLSDKPIAFLVTNEGIEQND